MALPKFRGASTVITLSKIKVRIFENRPFFWNFHSQVQIQTKFKFRVENRHFLKKTLFLAAKPGFFRNSFLKTTTFYI